MPRYDIQSFVRLLETRGELRRVSVPVSPVLEMSEIADRVSKHGGDALLFEHPADGGAPVLMNAIGSDGRMALSLGADSLDDIGTDVARYLDFGNYLSLKRLVKFVPRLFRLLCCFPLRRCFRLKRPPCRQVVEREVDLSSIPILRCWPLDGGRYLTLPLVFTKLPGAKHQNVGMYRMQVLDSRTTAMHWQKHKDGSAIYDAWRARGEKMPVAVALGASYAATYAADAQYVLEGYVDVDEELCWEGPLRGPHGLLLPGGLVPLLPCHLRHPAERPHLPRHHRGQAPHGGLLHGPRHRAHLSARSEAANAPASGD